MYGSEGKRAAAPPPAYPIGVGTSELQSLLAAIGVNR